MLLLDTHVLVWSVEGDARRIGRQSRRLLARAEAAGTIAVSPISLFEITALHGSGRLRLALPVDRWIREALEASAIRLAELSAEASIDAGHIPRAALEDPADRLLVATARHWEATLLTADARILHYALKTHNVRAQDAAR